MLVVSILPLVLGYVMPSVWLRRDAGSPALLGGCHPPYLDILSSYDRFKVYLHAINR
jgi:hypothetical protein